MKSKTLSSEASEVQSMEKLTSLLRIFRGFVLFSGGRDSLVTLHLVKSVADKIATRIEAVYVDTTISTPGIRSYVETICDCIGVQLHVLRPDVDYFSLVEKWGFPTITRRWCCFALKIKPIKTFLKRQEGRRLVLDGIRAEESPNRRRFPELGVHNHFQCLCYHPIFDWSSEDVRSYISSHQLFENPVYRLGMKRASECWCPVYKSINQLTSLKEIYPQFFERLVQLEDSLHTRGSMLFRNGERIYLKDL